MEDLGGMLVSVVVFCVILLVLAVFIRKGEGESVKEEDVSAFFKYLGVFSLGAVVLWMLTKCLN